MNNDGYDYVAIPGGTKIQPGDQLQLSDGRWVDYLPSYEGLQVWPGDKARRPVYVGVGWRILQQGEIIKPGDEYGPWGSGGWKEYKLCVGTVYAGVPGQSRRRIKNACLSEGWHEIEVGETLCPGDEVWAPFEGWVPFYPVAYGTNYAGISGYARRRRKDAVPPTPRWQHNQRRCEELLTAIMAKQRNGDEIPREWSDEYFSLLPVHAITKCERSS